MKEPLVIFLSAVSREFHLADPADPARFHSYRETLAESLRAIRQPHHIVTRRDVLQRLDPRSTPGRIAVISQENLAQGPADLLSTLEREVRAATLVIHLVGGMAGALPTAAERAALLDTVSGFAQLASQFPA
ncbi:MAG TPA: hypothetical protein PLF84_24685, partial [Bryobacteraceae bacterium]|nr:hypothetical protein [Bryobacteraceae bacterium]